MSATYVVVNLEVFIFSAMHMYSSTFLSMKSLWSFSEILWKMKSDTCYGMIFINKIILFYNSNEIYMMVWKDDKFDDWWKVCYVL